jgi:hypothetical protein
MPAYRALAQATVMTARPTADSLAELERVA